MKEVHACINRGVGKFDPEYRFAKFLQPGTAPEIRPELGACLIFTGASNGNGYGQFSYNGKNGYAHRYAWERVHGLIPDGMTVDHLCMVRKCVNVTHFELVDAVTNYLRGRRARTHCSKGHEYTPDNTYPGKNGRECKTCREEGARRGWKRRRRIANGLPDRRLKYDQALIRAGLERYSEGDVTLADLSKEIGCSAKYLSKLVSKSRGAEWVNRKRPSATSRPGGPSDSQLEEQGRRIVRARSGSICERCGSRRATDWHHRLNRSQGGSWSAANGLHLCPECHRFVTENPAVSYQRGWLVKRGHVPRLVPVVYRGEPVWIDDDGGVTPCTEVELVKVSQLLGFDVDMEA